MPEPASPDSDPLDFQRQVFSALRTNTFSSWWQFANWHRVWSPTVSGMEAGA